MTTTVTEIMAECHTRGIRLVSGDSDRLTVRGRPGTLPDDLRKQIEAQKVFILALLEGFEERAAILEFDAGLTREEAELKSRIEYFT